MVVCCCDVFGVDVVDWYYWVCFFVVDGVWDFVSCCCGCCFDDFCWFDFWIVEFGCVCGLFLDFGGCCVLFYLWVDWFVVVVWVCIYCFCFVGCGVVGVGLGGGIGFCCLFYVLLFWVEGVWGYLWFGFLC